MSKVVLNPTDIENLKFLLTMCPDTFSSVPVKFIKEDGESYISVEAIDINGDTVFSGKTIVNDLTTLEDNSGLAVRLPLNRALINNVLNSSFEELTITKNRISAVSPNKKLNMALLAINESDIFEFPYTNKELYELAVTENDVKDSKFVIFDIEFDQLKEVIDMVSVLSELDILEFKEKNGKLIVVGSDVVGNEFQYTFDVDVDPGFSGKYDTNLIKILNKVLRYKGKDTVKILVSDLLVGVTLQDDISTVTIAVTARRD